jgi:hypothetical protein
MDFITNFPTTSRKHDSIMLVVDKMCKATHFIFVKSTHNIDDIACIFMREIFKLHGLPSFWKSLFEKVLDTQLNFCTTYHPNTNG